MKTLYKDKLNESIKFMFSFTFRFALLFLIIINVSAKQSHQNYSENTVLRPYFFQNGNINTVFSSDGVFNFDRFTFPGGDAGFIWPVSANNRMTQVFSSGFLVGTQLIMPNNEREFRMTGAMYNGHFTPGIIPVPGNVPPQSICNDTLWKGYLVSLTDSSLMNGGARIKTAAGRMYSFSYSSWSSWPVSYGAPYVEVNNIPGYQPGWNSDRPGIGGSSVRPMEILYMIFMDYTNCTDSVRPTEMSGTGGTKPIGIELRQMIFMLDHPALYNAYFIKWWLINKSAKVMDSTYIGIYNDADLGYASDDAKGCDSVRGVGFEYNWDNDDEGFYGTAPPALGYNFLQTPIIHTNVNTDTAKFYCDTIAGYRQTGLTTFSNLQKHGDSCLQEPSNALTAYNFMKGLDGCGQPFYNPISGNPTKFKFPGDACNRTGWYDSAGGDKRGLLGSGPFVMQPMDTQIIIASFFTSRGTSNLNSVCRLLQYSDDIKALYGFLVCGYPILGINNNSGNEPYRFKLNQNYPNPFNPITIIKFDVPHNSFNPESSGQPLVQIRIFDILGREVEVLVNKNLQPGSYEAEWSASMFASGIYFCRLSVGDFSQSIKMVLIK